MKKLFFNIVFFLLVSVFNASHAQVIRFLYYPKANVYYNATSKEYLYSDHGSWVTMAVLPPEIALAGESGILIYSMKPEIWKMNAEHVETYRNSFKEKKKWIRLPILGTLFSGGNKKEEAAKGESGGL